jgi:hypothetical protein
MEKGLSVGGLRPGIREANVLRLAPPLVVDEAEIDRAVAILTEALAVGRSRAPPLDRLVVALVEQGFDYQPSLSGELLQLRPLGPDDFAPLYAAAATPRSGSSTR